MDRMRWIGASRSWFLGNGLTKVLCSENTLVDEKGARMGRRRVEMTDGRNLNCLVIKGTTARFWFLRKEWNGYPKEANIQGRLGGTIGSVCEIEAKRSSDEEEA